MKKLYLIVGLLALLPLLLISSGCEKSAIDSQKLIEAKVKYIDSDDWCHDYLLLVKDNNTPSGGTYYKPLNLPKDFEESNVDVLVDFVIIKDSTYNCGFAGYVPVVNINLIKKKL